MKGQLTIRLSDELEEGVALLARKLSRRRSDVVRLALQRLIEQEGTADEGRPFDLVQDLLGTVESNVPDLGSNHRTHLNRKLRRDA